MSCSVLAMMQGEDGRELGVVHLSFGKITQWPHNYLAEICSKGKKLQNRSTSWEKRELVTEVCSHHPFFQYILNKRI